MPKIDVTALAVYTHLLVCKSMTEDLPNRYIALVGPQSLCSEASPWDFDGILALWACNGGVARILEAVPSEACASLPVIFGSRRSLEFERIVVYADIHRVPRETSAPEI